MSNLLQYWINNFESDKCPSESKYYGKVLVDEVLPLLQELKERRESDAKIDKLVNALEQIFDKTNPFEENNDNLKDDIGQIAYKALKEVKRNEID